MYIHYEYTELRVSLDIYYMYKFVVVQMGIFALEVLERMKWSFSVLYFQIRRYQTQNPGRHFSPVGHFTL
jgi:hypothetical protein